MKKIKKSNYAGDPKHPQQVTDQTIDCVNISNDINLSSDSSGNTVAYPQVPEIKPILQVKNFQFIFLKHYKSGIVYLLKIRQEGSWQVNGQQDRGGL